MKSQFKPLLRRLLPKAIRAQRILGGPLRGYRIVTSWHDYPAAILGRTERPLLDWFAANVKSGETWLDIGAHYGYTAIALCRLVGKRGRVFAFEPMVSTAGYLAQTRWLNHLPQMTVIPLGLGCPDSIEVQRLPATRGMVDSTIAQSEGTDSDWQEAILVGRFDWLWPLICGGREQIDGVKIDVQGMEVDVLRGMVGTLKHYRPKLVVELHRGVDRSRLLDLVEAAGYSRRSVPIESVTGEIEPQYIDDRSYAFLPT